MAFQMKPQTPSPELAKVIGPEPVVRTQAVSKLWAYIREHQLQNVTNRRNINCDPNLKAVMGADEVTMFELSKKLSAHLT